MKRQVMLYRPLHGSVTNSHLPTAASIAHRETIKVRPVVEFPGVDRCFDVLVKYV